LIETLRDQLTKSPIPPSRLCIDCPGSFDRIILKAMAREPENRYQSGQEMAVDLERILGSDMLRSGGETFFGRGTYTQ